MTLLVPFDGSVLSEAALARAAEFAEAFDERVVTITVVPTGNTAYAREHGWIDEGEPFNESAVQSAIRRQVAGVTPDADARFERIGRYASAGEVAKPIRALARDVNASLVFLGSDDAGSIVSRVSSVGSKVANDGRYDVVIVRRPVSRTSRRARPESG